jgi:hypothetical protein
MQDEHVKLNLGSTIQQAEDSFNQPNELKFKEETN